MSDTTQTNAMAEIALALAMGFFSIMVLTMVSMGSSVALQTEQSVINESPITVAQSKRSENTQKDASQASKVKADDLVIFHNGRYLDSQFTPLTATEINQREKVVLAVSPDLAMSETMAARKQLTLRDVTVVMLDDRWQKALAEAKP